MTLAFPRSHSHADASPGELIRIERVIAVARMCLAVIALLALGLDPVEPAAYAPFAYVLLVLYAGHSVAAVLVLRTHPPRARLFARTIFTIDLMAAALTLPIAPPNNPFFAFFLFVLASAAVRWGFRETGATIAAALLFMLLHQHVVGYIPVLAFDGYDNVARLMVRAAYLVTMGVLLVYLADVGRQLRSETAAVVHVLGRIRVDLNITRALTTVSNETVRIFNASHLMVVVEELETQRLFRWDTVGGWSLASTTVRGESSVVHRPAYFFGSMGHSMAIVRRQWPWSSRASCETSALDQDGHLIDRPRQVVPDAFVTAHPFRRLILAPVTFGGEWAGRIFIFEPGRRTPLIEKTEFLRTLVRQVSPAVFNVYLQNRLQAKAGALERARVARELHDGVIQSLIGVEMQLEVLRGQAPLRDTPTGGEVLRLQNLVRDEVLNLRELMQQMRPAEFDPDELLDHFADMVQRFGRDTGIQARFVTDLKAVSLERRVCFELVRIVQEGLANVRRHSAATRVHVKFNIRDDAWRLEIGDDGRGFPFEGRLAQTELEARGLGPAIIRERVQAIGGQLTIDSTPGRGSLLEVLVPHESRG